jgi:protein subunit release factor A
MAFQFYDRLTQQLSHIQQTMDQLSLLIQDSDNLADEDRWLSLRTQLKNSYSMASEHQIYDAIMEGKTKQQALEMYQQLEKQQDDDDIELF